MSLLVVWDVSARYEFGYIGQRWRVSARWGRVILAWGPITAQGERIHRLAVLPPASAFGLTLPVLERSSLGISMLALPIWAPTTLVFAATAIRTRGCARVRRAVTTGAMRSSLFIGLVIFGSLICFWRVTSGSAWFLYHPQKRFPHVILGFADGSIGLARTVPRRYNNISMEGSGTWPPTGLPRLFRLAVGPNSERLSWAVVIPSYSFALACGVGVACIGVWRSRRNRGRGCRNCGYDLTGNVSGTCPECGCGVRRAQDADLIA